MTSATVSGTMGITRSPSKRSSARVVLNVGGKKFETLVETLKKYPNTMLGAMFLSNMAMPDDRGEYFFDRDPKIFEVILNFYRHGKIIMPQNLSPEMVKEELDFFGINVEEHAEGLTVGIELKKEADNVAQCKLAGFLEDFLIPRMRTQAQLGHYSLEVGFVPERHSMNNMTNLPSLSKNTDYYDLFSERENRKQLIRLMKALKINSQWDRSEQVNINTKEFLFECFKLTSWWSDDYKMEIGAESPAGTQPQAVQQLKPGSASF